MVVWALGFDAWNILFQPFIMIELTEMSENLRCKLRLNAFG